MPDEYATVRLKGIIEDVEFAKGVEAKYAQRRAALGTQSDAYDVRDTGNATLNRMMAALNLNTSAITDDTKRKDAELTKFIGEQFDKISQTMIKGVNMAFGVVDDIYKEMKKNSPLLQTLESLFNLAMQLFFMPLGNKLAEVLLPAVINLVETAAKMWDELGDGNLSQIFAKAIEYGVNAISRFFTDVGGILKSQGGMLGSIGKLMGSVGKFIEGNLFNVINSILNVVSFVVEHLKEIFTAIVAFKVASLMMQLVTSAAIIAGSQQAGGTSTGAPLAAKILSHGTGLVVGTTTATGVGTYAGLSALGFADGGVIKHTPGGRLITVAENEDEVVMPKSKAGMGGNVTNNFYGYTSDDIRDMIDRSVSEKISLSYIKGGY